MSTPRFNLSGDLTLGAGNNLAHGFSHGNWTGAAPHPRSSFRCCPAKPGNIGKRIVRASASAYEVPWLKPWARLFAALVLFVACSPPTTDPEHPAVASTAAADVVFTDVTQTAGINFIHHNGRSGKKLLPETLGSGVAFIDYDADGWPDLFFVNSKPWTRDEKVTSALYHNNQDGTFSDVTASAGLDIEMYGLGAAFGDYDNDGFDDLYVTALEGDRLFRNSGEGSFVDVTSTTGITNKGFGTSAAFLDFDKDGLLDLYVANYVKWSPDNDLWCTLDGSSKTFCTPESYEGLPSKLYWNLGDGTFDDYTEEAGLDDPNGKGLGVAVFDFDSDGWPDIFEANDTEPNRLFRNNQDRTFSEVGLTAGVAFAEDGKARGAMGVDAADYDRSGREHLIVGNFANEMLNLFHNEGGGLFLDEAPASQIGRTSLLSLTFGAFFFDYDNDGRLDIFTANGHLDEQINNVQPTVTYAQAPLLYRNLGRGAGFEMTNARVGEDLSRPIVARGAAYADYDRDGDLDIAVTTNNGPAHLFRNDGGNANSYLRVKLIGAESNRSAFGARVSLRSASGEQSRTVRSGGSYCSQSESTLTFGVGQDVNVDSLVIDWPSGRRQKFDALEVNQSLVIQEITGIASAGDRRGAASSIRSDKL